MDIPKVQRDKSSSRDSDLHVVTLISCSFLSSQTFRNHISSPLRYILTPLRLITAFNNIIVTVPQEWKLHLLFFVISRRAMFFHGEDPIAEIVGG
ncbi:unnamed protein product [Eruca vesicaria subsp. sativa]|uniref:Uncharacterized protein n=1 Tax=Eruca vesicaria subsp. sativa TaxID=29727 RepID=A0ABC8M5T0_ERUVS|nr:unnamed protein product [Eruca vesicaria subsp. sativa]